jgi:peroxiredoxin
MKQFRISRNLRATLQCATVIILLISLRIESFGSKTVPISSQITGKASLKDTTDKSKGASIPLNPQDISPLLTGEMIPSVALMDITGKSVRLIETVSKKPTILIFYRGGWCPYCSKQLSGVQLIEKDLMVMGYQVIAVSTDSPENLSGTMDKQKLSYTLLSDADLNVSKQFGIAFKAPSSYDKILPESSGYKNTDKLLPVPSVFILDKKGKILFEYINPNITERISPELLKAAASALREM